MFNPLIGILASSGVVAGGSYESIATTTLTSGQATISFDTSSLSAYKHLQLRGLLKHDYTGASGDYALVRFNGDTGNNYSLHRLSGDGSSASASAFSSSPAMYMGAVGTNNFASQNFSVMVMDILDFGSTSKNKTIRSLNGWDTNGAGVIMLNSGARYNTAAITSISFAPGSGTNWVSGTTIALYGIKD